MTSQSQRDSVAARWSHVGGGLVTPPSSEVSSLERLIADTAQVARDEARIFWIAASWLARYSDLVDVEVLQVALAELDVEPRAVAGALLSVAALEDQRVGRLLPAVGLRTPMVPARPLFRVVEETPALIPLLRDDTLPVFLAWGFWQDDITWKFDAIRPRERAV
jgi:hypothetical protein